MAKRIHSFMRIAAVTALAASYPQRLGSAAPPKSPCAEAQTQLAMSICWSNLAKNRERRVETRFSQLAAKLDRKNYPERAAAFEESQAKWRAYRDAHCRAVERLYGEGSTAPMQGASCRVRLAERREAELKSILSDLAGLAN